ncbi:MAG: ABC-2 family transporter protein [Fimbriimonadaceae bacterium]
MGRYFKVYKTFFTTSLIREMEFRANFIAKIAQNCIWIFFFVMILLVVYSRTKSIAGWDRGDALVLAATCFMMNALNNAFFFSLHEIPTHVRMGTLDFILTKPIDTQFWVSSRKFNFDQIGTLFAGIVMVIIGVSGNVGWPGTMQWLAYAVLVLASTVIFYAFNLMLMTTGIWLVRVDNLWVLGESMMQIARYPIDIYGPAIQRFFVFVLPLAFIATVPARQLVRGFDASMLAFGLGWALAFFLVARWFWRFALRHYTSASS